MVRRACRSDWSNQQDFLENLSLNLLWASMRLSSGFFNLQSYVCNTEGTANSCSAYSWLQGESGYLSPSDDATKIDDAISMSQAGGLRIRPQQLRLRVRVLLTKGRASAKKVMVILTDGDASACDGGTNSAGDIDYQYSCCLVSGYTHSDSAGCAAKEARDAGITIIAVGINVQKGNSVENFIKTKLVSSPADEHYLDISNIAQVQGKLEELLEKACPPQDCEEAGQNGEVVTLTLASRSGP